jgi:CHAT domain-containing protein
LPGAENEARAVAELLRNKEMEVKLLVGPKEATALEFQISLASTYDLIHYAGHGQFDDSAPRLSALVFSDGPYYAEELERSLQGAPFVFLSACEAGQAQTTMNSAGYQGRFVDGLAVAALVGGASGCLGPIWEIGDGAAREFALAFYAELLGGQAIGEAVRQARLVTRNLSPDCWASWLLYGDPFKKLDSSH